MIRVIDRIPTSGNQHKTRYRLNDLTSETTTRNTARQTMKFILKNLYFIAEPRARKKNYRNLHDSDIWKFTTET